MKKNRTTEIVCLHAGQNGWTPGTALPAELCVFPWGKHETQKGTFVCNEVTLAALPGNNKSRRFSKVALDFNHETLAGKEPVKLAAMGTPEVREGKGIYITNLEWTSTGKEFAENYPALSAGIKTNAKGEIIFLHSAALCRQGEVDGVTLLSAALPPFEDDDAEPTNEINLNDTMTDLRTALCKKYKIDTEGKSPEELDAAILAAAGAGESEPMGLSAEAIAAAIKPLADQVTALSAELADVKNIHTANEREQLLQDAATRGIVIPLSADRQKTVALDVLKDIIESSEENVVPLSADKIAERKNKAAVPVIPDEVAQIFGLSADDIKAAVKTA